MGAYQVLKFLQYRLNVAGEIRYILLWVLANVLSKSSLDKATTQFVIQKEVAGVLMIPFLLYSDSVWSHAQIKCTKA